MPTEHVTRADPYIRPCAAFPDGLFIPRGIVQKLLDDDLIESAYGWAENATKDDYAAIYSEEDMETVAYDIEEAVRRWIAP
jgi:hypothetical protein